MKQTKMISTRSSFLIRLMLVLLLALSLFAFAACQKDKQDSNVETPDDPSAHEHVFGEWVTTENPSCTVAGVKERICTVEGCGKKETASVDPLGHDTVHHAAQAATCIAVGWNAYDTCSRCDYTTYEEIAALGHDLVHHAAQVATCIAVGWNAYDTCSRCEYTTYEEIAKLGHEYEDHYCVRCDQLDPTYYTDGLIFELSMEDTYSVIGYNGAATDVVIPVTYRNNPVTLIRCGAFEQKGLTTILIPEGVTRVESKAFSYCPSLTSLNIPKSLTIIEESAFQRCNGLTSINVAGNNPKFHSAGNCLIETERKTLVLGCRNSVIPADDSVEKIGSYAFSGCSNLTSITIPGNVTIIGRGAFQDSGLISIIFSDGVVEFKEGAFAGCSNLTSIVFPKSVGMIENGAFYNCNRLTMVYYCGLISDNFGGNSSGNVFPYATRYYYSETEPTSDDDWWHYVDGAPTVWPREHAWGDWTTTTQPTCTEPGEKTRACTSCNATEWDEVPALGHKITHKSAAGPTCTKDGNVECWYCSACEKYFEDENGETKTTWDAVKINALGHDLVHHAAQAVSCTAIGWDAYDTCSRCDYTTYEEIAALGHDLVHHDAQAVTCTEYGWDAYDTCSRCDYTTYEKIAALGHNYNENNVCTRCNQLDPTYYTEGLSFTLLQDDTYSVKEYNGDATDVTIPSVYQNKAVTEIGVQAFFYLSNLTSVVIPDSVTSIQENAFTGCSGLTSITIPDSVTAIGGAAFNACSGLTSIYIPAGVTQIGIVAFTGCSGLTSISVAENNPEFHSAGNCLIHTASETLIAGCNNSVIPDDGSVTMIADDAFASCSGLTSFSIPEGVSFISFAVFCGCSNLSSIVIPDSVETIAGNAFEGCNNLTAVYYGGSASDWDGISIADYNNGCLTGATRYYYSETEPVSAGNWWHYVNGKPTVW